ncbi:hypothetical protein [Bacillus sp. 3255]|uniref:hypothetical protein n=1 Tax=Bacillus sp. 3255 TaxID=2817904 RepID=UPI0028591CF1|nr:hypothetical protein [Bacillus sp. 3255]MDR6880387.1 hypothetical protein [Bacillus sp. 3255]
MINHYNPFEEMTFTFDRCFLCGTYLKEDNSTEEHVFPKWLQREFNLWNNTLMLLNRTHIPYRNLVVPCCKICNNEHLNKKIEKKVEIAVKGGYKNFIQLDEEVIFKWLVKLSYGMLFKELSLRQDLTNYQSRKIIEPDELKNFRLLFTFLQSIRFETEFINKVPWSILIFKIKNSDNKRLYNGQDLIMTNNYFLQMNDIGIISHLQDNGLMKEHFLEYRSDFLDMELHPIQFRELCTEFQYKSYLLNKAPFYTISLPKDGEGKMQIISHDLYGDSLFDDWDMKEFCQLLEYNWKPWGIEFNDIYIDDEHKITFLRNEDGSLKFF